MPDRTVVTLDVGVLVRLAGLDEADVDSLLLAPIGEGPAGQLRAVLARTGADDVGRRRRMSEPQAGGEIKSGGRLKEIM